MPDHHFSMLLMKHLTECQDRQVAPPKQIRDLCRPQHKSHKIIITALYWMRRKKGWENGHQVKRVRSCFSSSLSRLIPFIPACPTRGVTDLSPSKLALETERKAWRYKRLYVNMLVITSKFAGRCPPAPSCKLFPNYVPPIKQRKKPPICTEQACPIGRYFLYYRPHSETTCRGNDNPH